MCMQEIEKIKLELETYKDGMIGVYDAAEKIRAIAFNEVQEMINHIDKLMELIPQGYGHNSDYANTLSDAIFYIRELQKDKIRLDWLSSTTQNIGNVTLPKECVENNLSSLRDAIDDAMTL